VRSLENACHIPERLRGVFTNRRYTNSRLPLPLPYLYRSVNSGCQTKVPKRLCVVVSYEGGMGEQRRRPVHSQPHRTLICPSVCRSIRHTTTRRNGIAIAVHTNTRAICLFAALCNQTAAFSASRVRLKLRERE